MSAVPSQALDAIALQLVTALERYAVDTGEMISNWPDLERYESVSTQIEQIRMYAAALSEARAPWVELLIAHSELVHLLWRVQYGEEHLSMDQTIGVRLHHTDAVAALRNRCMRIVARGRKKNERP
jgi:hypothetical protein